MIHFISVVSRLYGRVCVRMGVSVAILLGQKNERRGRKTDGQQTTIRIRVSGQHGQIGDHAAHRPMLPYVEHGHTHAPRRQRQGSGVHRENGNREGLGQAFGAIRGRRQLHSKLGLRVRKSHYFR